MASNRKHMPRKKDRATFRRTAAKAKKINIDPKPMRGGIRL